MDDPKLDALTRTISRRRVLAALAGGITTAALASGITVAAPPVRTEHPCLLLDSATLARLRAKRAANDPAWQALKTRADTLATYRVNRYEYDTRTDEPDSTIFYDYQGEGWYDATMPLGLAYQLSGEQAYAAKLLELADELLRAQSDPRNQPPKGALPLQVDDYYPTRYLPPLLAIIYDWCYDKLGPERRAKLVALMNAYFDDLRANSYQANDHADGNYLPSHLLATAAMGYASFSDNPRAPEQIAYARIRFDGTPSPLVAAGDVPADHFTQLFAGGYPPAIARDSNGPPVTGAPYKGGIPLQGWAYGSGTLSRIIDYLLMVRSATGEDLITPRLDWFSQILRAERHALLPNRFAIDPLGDWGGDQGAVIPRGLPARLAYVLAGTADGPAAQDFAVKEIAESTLPDVTVYPLSEWETLFFNDATRPAAAPTLPPYYTGFDPVYPQAGKTNGALSYFIQRSDWGADATWASAQLGSAWYDDHQHANAGEIIIFRGSDQLLVDAGSWKGAAGSSGISGSSTEEDNAAAANTLWFDDFGEFQRLWITGSDRDAQYAGGQAIYGKDEVIAAELTDAYSYVRSDLSTAYNRSGDPADQAGRRLDHFYRSFLYLRPANLFVVFDHVAAKPSRNPLGPYRKQLRWHLPNKPVISGPTVRVDQGASRLQIDTLLPAKPSLNAIDESHNPDPCGGPEPQCKPYEDWQSQSGTWRVEVSDPGNPDTIPFLTILQPGAKSRPAMTTELVTVRGDTMLGATISQPGGQASIVLFTNQPGQVPAPITGIAYEAPASPGTHTLCGLVPGAAYAVAREGSLVRVTQRAGGGMTASAAGVVQFMTPRS